MEIRPAATLALTRDTPEGLQVLMLQRTWDAVFLPGFYVFPGGAVDADDHLCRDWADGHDDASASHYLGITEGGSGYMIAAVRECFEEAGLLLANDDQDKPVSLDTATLERERAALNASERKLTDLCKQHRLTIPLDQLAYLSHWVTPPGPPRRFDTRFFVAVAPPNQIARHDGIETIDHVWLSPAQALEDHRLGHRLLGSPTVRTLRILSDFNTTDALMAYARSQPPEPLENRPWPARRAGQRVTIEPGAPAYDEVRKLDPRCQGTASATITPGVPVVLGPGVQRLTAGNAGMMTGPGTNTYVLGKPGDYTVIDPGPEDENHLRQLLDITGGAITRVLVTHTHRDHSPGAAALRETTGATLVGMKAPEGASQDASFRPDRVPVHDDEIETAAGKLKVLHTPGHASNHLCYLLEGQNLLFSGDHIMQGSTVVINPPDGDMKAYLVSLHALLEENISYIAPGHGFLLGHAHAVIDYLTTHRMAREHKVLAALKDHGPATLKNLTAHAYDDVPTAIHGLASRSLLAHLLKLQQERVAALSDDQWQLIRQNN
ncbi:MAG: MBL fold metallo-hydrolase [Marinobacter sp.]|uniref:MBL fold metallo-hydrolase n=1 Tax=Marinobacter sp. TaxID=50741 RepID=UPI0034A04313